MIQQLLFNSFLFLFIFLGVYFLRNIFILYCYLIQKRRWLDLKNIIVTGILSKIGNLINLTYFTFLIFDSIKVLYKIQETPELSHQILNSYIYNLLLPNFYFMVLVHITIGIGQRSLDFIELEKSKKKYGSKYNI